MDLLIIGHPNVGKTLFMINFAAYLGLREIRVDVVDDDGRRATRRLTLERARRDLVSVAAPKTVHMQSLALDIPQGRQRLHLVLVDTPGVADGIADSVMERHLAAVAIGRLLTATLVLHLVDASAVHARRAESPGLLDLALSQWGAGRTGYVVVANKMDRPGSVEGLRWLREQYRGTVIIPVSSVTRRGFRDVKGWIVRTTV